MGSLFDGIGGFPLAAIRNGVSPIWASEIEAFPIAVTKIRFPQMLHVGDITKLDGATLPPVDIICGGSPCQDLSVAGKRAGLEGERSGLFMDQVRIVKEMRYADELRGLPVGSRRPRYLVWENVPGAFSSAEGEDFRAVLEEIVRVCHSTAHIPRPDTGAWKSAGAIILGGEFSLAWRVLDAQYWGVAQRRRRIFLVADFGGLTAPQILFKQSSLLGNPAEEPSQREGIATPTETGTGDSRGTTPHKITAFAANQRDEVRDLHDVSGAIQAQPGMKQQTFVADTESVRSFHVNQRDEIIDLKGISGALMATRTMQMQTFVAEPFFCLCDQGGERMDVLDNQVGTLRAGMGGNIPIVMGSQQGGAEICENLCPTITSAAGTSGNNQPVLYDNHARDCRYNGPLSVAPTIASVYGTGGNNVPLVEQAPKSYCIAGNIIDREVQNGGNGLGCQEGVAYTLTGADRHAVMPYQEVIGALCSGDQKGVNSQYVSQDKCIISPAVFGESSFGDYGDGVSTIRASGGNNGGGSENLAITHNLVRRLTPLECERLQGFPDGWTDIPKASDSARYKALGNSVAIPCVDFVLRGIAFILKKSKEDSSNV
ncbi:DNA (cytosine-5-)-methyltransferase [Bengtsoniella intestinalis]